MARSAWAMMMGVAGLLGVGCSGGGGGEDPPPTGDTLGATGLYASVASGDLAPGVREYEPAFALWSDGAEKRRYVWLPAGSTIDTSDMDAWVFPVGAKLWKEFSRDGVRVETRLLEKRAPGDWRMIAYLWNEAGTDATPVPEGRSDARGTAHDVPDTEACGDCHGGQADAVIGFSALLLDHEGPGVTLSALAEEGRLSHAPSGPLRVPGDDTTAQALGYMHANCGGCHNERNDWNPLRLWLTVADLATPEATPTWRTTVDAPTMADRGAAPG